jgi:hypothetical protein
VNYQLFLIDSAGKERPNIHDNKAWPFPPMVNGLFPEVWISLFASGIATPAKSSVLFLGIEMLLEAWPFPHMANGLFLEVWIKLSASRIAKPVNNSIAYR